MSYNLNSIFSAVIFKTLAQVDLPGGSNQHEINGVSTVKEFFETDQPISGTINWHYFSDVSETLQSTGNFKFYDARAKSVERTGRTEWRMYYTGEFISCANPGDILVLARALDGKIFGLVFQNNSSWLRTARVLFQFEDATPRMQLITSEDLQGQELEFAKRQILEELGIEISIPSLEADDEIAARELALANEARRDFPSTGRMSELAQSLVEVDSMDADTALVAFIDREERIFRAIEKILVTIKLNEGFLSVDDFISYSLSVQNRRKSRMGYALQNHLSKIFIDNQLRFDPQVITEGRNKPDFIFPGRREYRDVEFNAGLLVMLASKSSCKERWTQILGEAERIPNKHLCTLEQAISVEQTRAMKVRNVTLVIPSIFHATYTDAQQRDLWTINQFVDYVRSLQSR
jgi:hypothetical protein